MDEFLFCSSVHTQRLVHLRLDVKPKTQNLRIPKWQDLRADQPSDSVLSIAPPPAVWQSSPESGAFRSPGRTSIAQHERQAPSLRRVSGNWVNLWNRIRQVWNRIWDVLASKIRKIGDLVLEHLIYRGLLQDLLIGGWGRAVV